MKTITLIAGMILLLASAGWQFALKDSYLQRFPDDWKWEFTTLIYTDIETGSFIDEEYLGTELNPINTAERSYTVTPADTPDGIANIYHEIRMLNIITNATVWELASNDLVNAKTGRSYGRGDDSYFFFPSGLEKKDYVVSTSTHSGLLYTFIQEENLYGLDTYVFSFAGQVDNSLQYESLGIATAEQGVICYEAKFDYWVEPNTGEVVQFTEDCAGDYVVNKASGEQLFPLARWRGETSGDDLIRRLDEVKSMIRQRQLVEQYIPLALLLGGLGGVLIAGRQHDRTD